MLNVKTIKNLEVPKGIVDVVLDTDAYNETDDQFAISYMLRSPEKLNPLAIHAAPFLNGKVSCPKEGMEKSYDEILNILRLNGREDMNDKVFKGSEDYLLNETTPRESDAARNLIKLALEHSPEKPLYVVTIGCIVNVASALIMNPSIADNIVIVWLGGNSLEYTDTDEFNMGQDMAAARVVFKSEAPLVQLPCMGVVSEFRTTKSEMERWLVGKSELCDYLAGAAIEESEGWAPNYPWSRVTWDVTAVGWLLNDNNRFMLSRIEKRRIPSYDKTYSYSGDGLMTYVYQINRDALYYDLFMKLTQK